MANNIQYVAGGNIYPCRFIQQSPAGTFTAIQVAVAGDPSFGISQEGTTVVPIDGYTDASSVFAATAGLPVPYWGEHDECLLEIAGTVTQGDLLKSDADGKGVTGTAGTDKCGARALQSGVAGEKIRVVVLDSTR